MNSRLHLFCVGIFALSSLAATREGSVVEAVNAGDVHAVRLLLRRGTDVNVPDASGTTALSWAVYRNDVTLATELLRAGAHVNAANRYGARPLLVAAENGHEGLIRLLLQAGADPETAFAGGETALMIASRGNHADAVRTLTAAGADVNAVEQSRGQTALMWAAHSGGADTIRVLLEGGANLTARTDSAKYGSRRPSTLAPPFALDAAPTGFTPLLFAVRAGRLDAVRALLDAGASPNDTLSEGQSALVVATANAHWEVADLLLDRGADPRLAGAGWNALHQLIRTRRMTNTGAEAPSPIPTGNVDSLALAKKMIARGADVNARLSTIGMNDGQRNRLLRLGATAFFLAAKGVDVEAMRMLLVAGADGTIPNAEGTTPLMVAAGLKLWNPGQDSGTLPGQEAEALDAVKICVDAGNDVNATNGEKETALHGVAYAGNNLIVNYLVEQGAKLDARDVRGWSALGIANGFTYTNFYKDQKHTAELLRTLMQARGLPTEGHEIPSDACLDCSVIATQSREFVDRWKQMEAEYAKVK